MSKSIPIYQVDAFAERPFEGNPAAVCPLEEWLDDDTLQRIAQENNLSETAFFVPNGSGYDLRWFTPVFEIDLCGHATLASAYIIFKVLGYTSGEILFQTKSGKLKVTENGDLLEMDFPSWQAEAVDNPSEVALGLGKEPIEVLKTRDYLAIYERSEDVASLQPDYGVLQKLDAVGVIASAPGRDYDFVSRFFAPQAGVNEDPVTGSAHSTLIPYWAAKLNKNKLVARQISPRGGTLNCRYHGERVAISGHSVLFMEGHLHI